MPGFVLRHGALACDDVPLPAIAREVGTPVHVYSASIIRERYRALDAALSSVPHAIHYAIKANSTVAVVRLLHELGARADANSWGEIEVARRAGIDAAEIVFTGVGKRDDEIARAIGFGVQTINAESAGEVERIDAIASRLGRRARVALRVNPDVDAGSHPHMSTGRSTTKFGMSVEDARRVARESRGRSGVELVGLHVHVGSQITSAEPLARAAAVLADAVRSLQSDGIPLEQLDLGGGLGVAYAPDFTVLSPADYAAAVLPPLAPLGLRLIFEPGRWLLAPAGVLVTSVLDIKPAGAGRVFVVADAGMTELMRPALYDAWHRIEPVVPAAGDEVVCDVVGPVCETADLLGRARRLPPMTVGDLLVVRDTGAYGAVMASNYNRRPTAAEVLVDGGAWRIVRRRQTVDEMLEWDV